jgi:hypothetical protein
MVTMSLQLSPAKTNSKFKPKFYTPKVLHRRELSSVESTKEN